MGGLRITLVPMAEKHNNDDDGNAIYQAMRLMIEYIEYRTEWLKNPTIRAKLIREDRVELTALKKAAEITRKWLKEKSR